MKYDITQSIHHLIGIVCINLFNRLVGSSTTTLWTSLFPIARCPASFYHFDSFRRQERHRDHFPASLLASLTSASSSA